MGTQGRYRVNRSQELFTLLARLSPPASTGQRGSVTHGFQAPSYPSPALSGLRIPAPSRKHSAQLTGHHHEQREPQRQQERRSPLPHRLHAERRAEPSRAVPSPTRRPRPFPGRTAPSGTGTASSPPRRCAGIGGGQRAAPGGRTAPGPWGAVREGMRPRGPGGEAEHRRRGQHAAPAASAVFRSPSRAILLGRDAPCTGCVPVTQPCVSPAPDSNAQTLCAATVPPREVPKSPTQPLSGISMQSKRTTVLPSVRCLGLIESWNGLYRRGP